APAQIVSDARKNGVEVREVDVSHSFAQNTLEQGSGRYCAVRLGFRQIDGFHWIDPDERRLKQIQQSMRDTHEERETHSEDLLLESVGPRSRFTSPRRGE